MRHQPATCQYVHTNRSSPLTCTAALLSAPCCLVGAAGNMNALPLMLVSAVCNQHDMPFYQSEWMGGQVSKWEGAKRRGECVKAGRPDP